MSGQLKITEVNQCFERNGTYHKTGMYHLMTRDNKRLIVRRGIPFALELTLNRRFNPDTDGISFIFTHQFVENPSVGRNTKLVIPLLYHQENKMIWKAYLVKYVENVISVVIIPSADCIIGKWLLEIDAVVRNEGSTTYKCKDPMYILFNAWCKEDAVYIDAAANRKEYVSTEVGMIWTGTIAEPRNNIWKYGQFDEDVLDCSLMLLDKIVKLTITKWNDPAIVGRAISAAVCWGNSNSVLKGNWSKDYSGGKKPSEWTGSHEILKEYYGTKQKVKYGQCYVCAGVATTVCRALGIPARTITCYNTSKDKDGSSLTVDVYLDNKGEVDKSITKDVIWNYHAWTEIWTKRPDLGTAYDGWQVIENSTSIKIDNFYQCGPASVNAIKKGEIKRPYDAEMIYAELNADIAYWKFQGKDKPLKLLKTDTTGIGQFISTKAVGSFEREDITYQYKYPDYSREERSAIVRALKASDILESRYYLNQNFGNVTFDLQMPNDIIIGSSCSINLKAKNAGTEHYNVTIFLSSTAKYSNGTVAYLIKRDEKRFAMPAKSEQTVTMVLIYPEYAAFISYGCINEISALCRVDGTDFEYFAHEDLKIKFPSLTVQVEGMPVVNTILSGSAFFKNPLPATLKNCVFLIDGVGIHEGLRYRINNVPQDGEVKTNFQMIPTFYGKQTIVAKFISNRLPNIEGHLAIHVHRSA